MENIVLELKEKSAIEQAIKFVERRFLETEQAFYSKEDLLIAKKCLQSFDVMDVSQIEAQIKKKNVKVFVGLCDGKIYGVCALDIPSGKILFLATSEEDVKNTILREMIERMVEERAEEPDSRLNVMAFVGQEKTLASVGFRKLYDTVLFYRGVQLVPMKYSYTQFDIEK